MGSFFSLKVLHIPGCANMTDEMLRCARVIFLGTPLLWMGNGEFNAYLILNTPIYTVKVCFLLLGRYFMVPELSIYECFK